MVLSSLLETLMEERIKLHEASTLLESAKTQDLPFQNMFDIALDHRLSFAVTNSLEDGLRMVFGPDGPTDDDFEIDWLGTHPLPPLATTPRLMQAAECMLDHNDPALRDLSSKFAEELARHCVAQVRAPPCCRCCVCCQCTKSVTAGR